MVDFKIGVAVGRNLRKCVVSEMDEIQRSAKGRSGWRLETGGLGQDGVPAQAFLFFFPFV
jgi:hypothetical protein